MSSDDGTQEKWVTTRVTTTFVFGEGDPPDNRPRFVVVNMGGNGSAGIDPKKGTAEPMGRHESDAVTTLELSDPTHAYEHVLIAPGLHSDQLQEHHLAAMLKVISESEALQIMILIGTRRIVNVLDRIHSTTDVMAGIQAKRQKVCLVGSLFPICVPEGDARPSLGAAFAYLQTANAGDVFMSVHMKRFDNGKVRLTESDNFVIAE